jgi:hypothetical protein
VVLFRGVAPGVAFLAANPRHVLVRARLVIEAPVHSHSHSHLSPVLESLAGDVASLAPVLEALEAEVLTLAAVVIE